jgi:hypothetical protein
VQSYHNYPLNVCGTNPPKPTIYQLLEDKSAQEEAQHLQPYVSVAAANKVPFYIGEGNSVACGGAYNVSNVFAATLWVRFLPFLLAPSIYSFIYTY